MKGDIKKTKYWRAKNVRQTEILRDFIFFSSLFERARELAYTHDIAHPRLSVEMIHSDYSRLRCMPNPVPQIQMINHQQHHSQRHQHYIQVPCLPPHLFHRIHSAPLNPTSKISEITHNSSNLQTSATVLLLLELFETLKVSRKRVFQCLRCDATQSRRQWLLAGIWSLRLARPDAFLADHFCRGREGGKDGVVPWGAVSRDGGWRVLPRVGWRGVTGHITTTVTWLWVMMTCRCTIGWEVKKAVNLRREGWRFGWGFIEIGHRRSLHEHSVLFTH